MEVFLKSLEECFLARSPHEILEPFRKMAWERFLHLGPPTKKSGPFQYVPLHELYKEQYVDLSRDQPQLVSQIAEGCAGSYLVFIDGVFHPTLSSLPQHVIVCPLQQAFLSFGHFLKNRLLAIKEERDPFVALNGALQEEGVFIYIPPQVKLKAPLQLIHHYTRSASPGVHLFVSRGAQATLVTTVHFHTQEALLINSLLDITLEEEADCSHFDFSYAEAKSWYFQALRAQLKQKSHLHAVCASTGARVLRHDFKVLLLEEEAEVALEGLWNLRARNQVHTHVFVQHKAPACRSTQKFKGVLEDVSQSSFEGKIYVDPKAQKTQAYQKNSHLLLSDHAQARAKPNLEIFADDVKASHGATVGQIDPKQLFYLKSRGICETVARQLLIQGFCGEILNQIPFPTLLQHLKLV